MASSGRRGGRRTRQMRSEASGARLGPNAHGGPRARNAAPAQAEASGELGRRQGRRRPHGAARPCATSGVCSVQATEPLASCAVHTEVS